MSLRIRLLTSGEIAATLPMDKAVEAMGEAFADLSMGRAVMPHRTALHAPDVPGTLLLKPAMIPGSSFGAKLVSFFPRNAALGLPTVTGLMVLLDPASGLPAAIMDGAFLTAWRTGAASGLATKLLARPDARIAGLIGCGAQARTQLLAIDTVRDLAVVKVFARTESAVHRFVREMAPRVRAGLSAAASPVDAVGDADVICTATTSEEPVFDGRHIAPGCHVNAVGSFTPAMRELDGHAVGRARIFVDQRRAALAEAGDLIQAVAEGLTSPEEWAELGEVAEGAKAGRGGEKEITLFKSVGVAVQDVVAAALVLKAAEEQGLGTMIDL